ncbi:unnamed protein product [Arabidopsis thaliana]|uniref:Uncharacterized protein n=1 Tax=Arabidopsis thaliana TaxID=3702 RepID=A0A654ES77_ARATH|nr:unnamed protein product [Arabidopsis thaliana]
MAEEFATFFSPLKEERSTPPKTQTTTPLTATNNPKSQKRLRGLPLEERPDGPADRSRTCYKLRIWALALKNQYKVLYGEFMSSFFTLRSHDEAVEEYPRAIYYQVETIYDTTSRYKLISFDYGNLGHGDTRMVQDLFLCDGGFNKMAHLGGYYGGEIVLHLFKGSYALFAIAVYDHTLVEDFAKPVYMVESVKASTDFSNLVNFF